MEGTDRQKERVGVETNDWTAEARKMGGTQQLMAGLPAVSEIMFLSIRRPRAINLIGQTIRLVDSETCCNIKERNTR